MNCDVVIVKGIRESCSFSDGSELFFLRSFPAGDRETLQPLVTKAEMEVLSQHGLGWRATFQGHLVHFSCSQEGHL